jgi:hypothetical protein
MPDSSQSFHFKAPFCRTGVVSCGPEGERILDVVRGGPELVLKLRRGVGQAATLAIIHAPSVLEFIKHK